MSPPTHAALYEECERITDKFRRLIDDAGAVTPEAREEYESSFERLEEQARQAGVDHFASPPDERGALLTAHNVYSVEHSFFAEALANLGVDLRHRPGGVKVFYRHDTTGDVAVYRGSRLIRVYCRTAIHNESERLRRQWAVQGAMARRRSAGGRSSGVRITIWRTARSGISCRTSSGDRRTKRAASADRDDGGGSEPPEPPARGGFGGPVRDEDLRAELAAFTVRLARRLDLIEARLGDAERAAEHARRFALDALDLAGDR